jgi:hypothetical protein
LGKNFAARIDPAAVAKPNIHQHHIGLRPNGLVHCRFRGGRFGHHFVSLGMLEQRAQSDTDDLVIVYKQYPYRSLKCRH